MPLLRSGIWIQSWPSCWQGARGAPAQLVAGQSLCIPSVGRHLRGLGWGWVRIWSIAWVWGERAELWGSYPP